MIAAMPYDKAIHMLAGGGVMVECGPMRLVIRAWVGRVPQPQAAARAAEEAVTFLERLARVRPLLGGGWHERLPRLREPLALKMAASVAAVGDEDLTPMAAVAGTIADAVADFLVDRGQTRVIVENGGDVAVRIGDGEAVTVGIRPEVGEARMAQVIALGPERASWGVATSGLGGRSLTRGVVSAAMVVAGDAARADAAATAVANASLVEDDAVVPRGRRGARPAHRHPGAGGHRRGGAARRACPGPGSVPRHPQGRGVDRRGGRFRRLCGSAGEGGHDGLRRSATGGQAGRQALTIAPQVINGDDFVRSPSSPLKRGRQGARVPPSEAYF